MQCVRDMRNMPTHAISRNFFPVMRTRIKSHFIHGSHQLLVTSNCLRLTRRRAFFGLCRGITGSLLGLCPYPRLLGLDTAAGTQLYQRW